MSARTDTHRMIQHNELDSPPLTRSPPRSFAQYDRYVPARASTSYRDDYSHRASSWRPNERQPPYYNRTPSPNRYDSARALDDPWTRSPYSSSGWPDRRSSDLWGLSRRRESGTERSFEPSEAWKQNYNDPRPRQDALPPQSGDRYLPSYSRDTRDYAQPPRSGHYSPPPSPGDHYRSYSNPYESHNLFPHSRADSYRPQYEDDVPWGAAPINSAPRGLRPRTPDEYGSPSRDSRPAYVHRLPISHADREARHYSPTRLADYSPIRGRRSPSPSAYRYNNIRNNDLLPRTQAPRRVSSPSRSFKREHSPSIPGLIHDPRRTSSRERSRTISTTSPQKRRTPSPVDMHRSPKKLRSASPDRQSSIASSRRSSPEPILVVDKLAVVQPVDNAPVKPKEPPAKQHLSPEDSTVGTPVPKISPNVSNVVLEVPGMSFADTSPLPGLGLQEAFVHKEHVSPPLPQDPESPRASIPDGLVSKSTPNQWLGDRETTNVRTETKSAMKEPANMAHALVDLNPKVQSPILDTQISPAENLIQDEVLDVVGIESQSENDENHPEILRHSSSYQTSSIAEALKHVVMTRHLHDIHRRDERVEPILLSNLSICETLENPKQEWNVEDHMSGSPLDERRKKFDRLVPHFTHAIQDRRNALEEKVQRLREEYLELHNNWLEHCARLDDAAKGGTPDDSVAVAGRTTRRSAATLGDAVRSDLEMEQIIASLGNDDLTDANHLSMRNAAFVPDMISVTRGQVDYMYDDTNNLVEDAVEFYAARTGIHDWTDEEKQIFIEQYAAYPKQFGTIAEYLPDKTAAQCVAFYYLHKKKHIDFRKVIQRYAPTKRRRGRKTDKQRGNALLADIRRHDAEVEISSYEMDASEAGPSKKRKPGRPPNSRRAQQFELTPATTPTPAVTPDPEPVPRSRGGRRINLRIPAIIEADETEEEEEELKPIKKPAGRRGRKPKVPKPTSSEEPVPPPEPQETNSRRRPQSNAQWSEDDQNFFVGLVSQHGADFKQIAASMPNKTVVQVSVFYNTNLKRLGLDTIASNSSRRTRSPSPIPSPPNPTTPPLDPPSRARKSREDEQGPRKVAFEYPGSGIMSPHQLSTPPLPVQAERSPSTNHTHYDQNLTVPIHHPDRWDPAYDEACNRQPNWRTLPSMQHQSYYPSQQMPYNNYHHNAPTASAPALIIPNPESHKAHRGEAFFINDYHHSRGPHPAQSSSMAVIPGMVETTVPDYDPQYHQPVIRVQQQNTQHEPPITSSFMTGRVLLTTKAYSGCPTGAGSFS